MPIFLVVSSPLAIRAFISVLDNKQLLCSTRSSTRASNGVCQPASNGVCQPDGGPNVEQSNCLLSKTEIKALIARGELTTRRIGTITPRHNLIFKKNQTSGPTQFTEYLEHYNIRHEMNYIAK